MSREVHSFDVFDTLITRPWLRPAGLFHAIGTELATIHPGRFAPAQYAAARAEAERRARRAARPRDDCTLDEILAACGALAEWGVAPAEARAAEVEAERAAARPVAENVARVAALHAAGHTIVFLSDMYLPGDFVHELLCRHVAAVARESVFVSGELGLAKRSGRLYRHVLAQLAVPPAALVHVGDHPLADDAVPRRLGIRVAPYRGSAPNRYERLARPRSRAPLWRVASAGAARAARLGVADGSDAGRTLARLACNVVAPLLTAFVAWVLADARARGLARLYFVSRDGQVFQRIAAELRRDGDPECRYLYGSRQAWFLPATLCVDAGSLEWAWLDSMARSGVAILRRLECDTPEVRARLAAAGFDHTALATRLDQTRFGHLRALLLSAPLAGLIAARAAERRATTLDYLRQEGLCDALDYALVDVGWSLRSQRALGRLLTAAGAPRELRGYYFGVSATHIPLAGVGQVHAFITPPGSDLASPLTAAWLFRSVLLVEHLFTVADHPTARGYRAEGMRVVPEFKDEARDPRVLAFARTLQAAVVAATREFAAQPALDPTDPAFRAGAAAAMRAFCLAPEATDVSGIAWLPTNRDQSHDASLESRLADCLSLADLWRMLRHLVLRPGVPYFNPRYTWLLGSAALSPAPVRWLCRALYRLYVLGQARPARKRA